MMDILAMLQTALEKDEFIHFLRGNKGYMIEWSQYAPDVELTNVDKVLARGIYKMYKVDPSIKDIYEKSLEKMLDMTDFDVYMVVSYMMSQLFNEKNGMSPFMIERENIIQKMREELNKRKNSITEGIVYPSQYVNKNAWNELERFNIVCKEEYGVMLFHLK